MTRTRSGLLLLAAVAIASPGRIVAQEDDSLKPSQLPGLLRQGQDIEITNELLDDFGTGIETELRLFAEFWKELRAYKTAEQYTACEEAAKTSPEMQQQLLKSLSGMQGATPDDARHLAEKLEADKQAFISSRCGSSLDQTWPPRKRQQRLVEIHDAGAAAFEAARTARTPGTSGPAAPEEFWALAASSELYDLLLDKLVPFCRAMELGLIVANQSNGQVTFSFLSAQLLSTIYTQQAAAAQWRFCKAKQAQLKARLSMQSAAYNPGGFGPWP